jgi:hypothetical protein
VSSAHCPFCGVRLQAKGRRIAGKTDEHIIPQWLLDHLGIRSITVFSHLLSKGQMVEYCRRPANRFVNGRVCEHCNNGWMSHLENQAKPILLQLIADPQGLGKLSPNERHILALWTFKTIAALNRTSHRETDAQYVPEKHVISLRYGTISDDVFIVGAGCPSNRPADFLECATWAIPKNSIPLLKEELQQSYKIGLSLRGLFLAAAYYPNKEYHYVVINGRYAILWGSTNRVILNHEGVGDVPLHANMPLHEEFLGNIFLVSDTYWKLTNNIENSRLLIRRFEKGTFYH